MRARLLAVCALAVASCGCLTAWSAPAAEPYGAVVTGAPDGPNAWIYTVQNTSSDTDLSVWLLQIEVDDATSVSSVSTPALWTDNMDIPFLIMWQTGSRYVPAGQSLSGFRAQFSSQPAYQYWTVMFRSAGVQGEYPVDFGDVLIPEPAGILATLIGLGSLAGLVARRRERD